MCAKFGHGPMVMSKKMWGGGCNIVFRSDKINTRVVSNIIEQEVSTSETVKDTFA